MPIEFKNPPNRRYGKQSDWREAIAALIEHTGQWAVIRSYSNPNSANVIRWRIKHSERAWVGHRWDAVTRMNQETGEADLFVRHLGPSKDGA